MLPLREALRDLAPFCPRSDVWAVNPWVKPVGPVVTVVLMSEISPRSWLTMSGFHNVLSIDSIAVLFENWTNPSTPVFLF